MGPKSGVGSPRSISPGVALSAVAFIVDRVAKTLSRLSVPVKSRRVSNTRLGVTDLPFKQYFLKLFQSSITCVPFIIHLNREAREDVSFQTIANIGPGNLKWATPKQQISREYYILVYQRSGGKLERSNLCFQRKSVSTL